MTREEAIKTIEVIKCEAEWEYPLSWQLSLQMAIESLKAQEWIPCSKGLPEIREGETSDMVLLCWSDEQRTVGAYQGNRTFCGQAWPAAKDTRTTVVAWMPLPEPYKEEQE